jgi:hypothetical protein
VTLKPSSRTLKPWVIEVTGWKDQDSPSETRAAASAIHPDSGSMGRNFLDGSLMRPLYFHYLFVISSHDTAKIHAFEVKNQRRTRG